MNEELVAQMRAANRKAVEPLVTEILEEGPVCITASNSKATCIAAALQADLRVGIVDADGWFDHHGADFDGLRVDGDTLLLLEQDKLHIHLMFGTFDNVGCVLIYNPTEATTKLSDAFLDKGCTVLLIKEKP